MPCLVPTCPTSPGPSGFCRFHKNRLNARSSAYAEYMTDADRIAIAAHPGWRGRKWQLNAIMWADGLHYHASPDHGVGPGYKTAAEALAEVDRRNGLTPAADVARLEAEIAAIRTHRDGLEERRRELVADNDVLAGGVCFFVRVADGMRYALDEQTADLSALRRRLADMEREAADQRHRAEAAEDALTDLAAIARGEMADPWPADEAKPDTVGGRAYDAVSRLVTERDAAREALDRQSTTIAGLRSEREAAVAELATARQFAASDAAIIDNLRTGLRLLTDELTLARRPWWARLWAWVTGGGE